MYRPVEPTLYASISAPSKSARLAEPTSTRSNTSLYDSPTSGASVSARVAGTRTLFHRCASGTPEASTMPSHLSMATTPSGCAAASDMALTQSVVTLGGGPMFRIRSKNALMSAAEVYGGFVPRLPLVPLRAMAILWHGTRTRPGRPWTTGGWSATWLASRGGDGPQTALREAPAAGTRPHLLGVGEELHHPRRGVPRSRGVRGCREPA